MEALGDLFAESPESWRGQAGGVGGWANRCGDSRVVCFVFVLSRERVEEDSELRSALASVHGPLCGSQTTDELDL